MQSDIETRLARLESFRDICNLQGRYNHYLLTGQLKEKMGELFAFEHPGAKAELADSGVWEGGENIGKLFKHMGTKYSMPGALMLHMLMTPVLEVSADNKTAKGMWHSFGANTYVTESGGIEAMWQAGKYDLTFINQGGQWKYLEFKWYVIFRTPYDKGWVNQPIVEGLQAAGFPLPSELHSPYDPKRAENDILPYPPEAWWSK